MKKENSKIPDLVTLEKEILKFWQDNKSFEALKAKNKNSGKYYRFLDGPITANYPMGLHHGWNRSLKDFMLRYKAMNGYEAHYQNGFDAHGLPVELGVEKDLGLADKRDIYKLGMDVFVEKCLERVKKYSKIISEQSIRLGQWMDWNDSYFTNSDSNITAIWYFLRECHKRGWIIEKYRPLPWCAHCGTSLSEHELADNYKDIEHTAVFFKAPVEGENYDMLVWTTTPWTLSSNVALAVNENLEYLICKVKSSDRMVVVCKNAKKVLKDDLISVENVVCGKEFVGKSYETCFPQIQKQCFKHQIVAWDHVDDVEGSGVVHIAPGCGAEDFELGEKLGLPCICPIDESGIFYNDFDFLAGRCASECADLVFSKLSESKKLYYTHKYLHRYPTCGRCKNPLLFRLTKEWFIKADEIRPKLLEAVETVEWQPEFLKKRMIDWLENMGDWSISRKRFYGIPLPFYKCKECGELTVVGSLEELAKLSSQQEVDSLPHIHRPYIDDIKINCPHCGLKVERIPEVGDCWLDAGITPFSTKKYFTDKEFFNKNFPAECVIEMKEQVRLWFYSLLFMSVTLVGKAPYQKVVGFASLTAEDGTKFSKSGKNCITFFEAADKIGSDVIRYMYACNNMMNDTRFGYSITDELKRKLMGLWNAYVFFNTYASIDNPNIDNYKPDFDKMNAVDKWLIQKTNNIIKLARNCYENQSFYVLTKEFEIYLDDLSNWYIRTNRKRFWKNDQADDKMNAYWVLYGAIKCIVQIMSPIVPFITEYIWQNMVREVQSDAPHSVFLSDFPNEMYEIDCDDLIAQTEIVRSVIASAQRLRNENHIKVKQPLKTMYVICDEQCEKALKNFEDILKEELNIRDVIFEKDNKKFNTPYLSLNFRLAGTALKSDVQKARQILLDSTPEKMAEYVAMYERGSVNIAGHDNLPKEIFLLNYKAKDDYIISTENNITIVLDITIDEQLYKEGLLREITRALQVLRKKANFNIEARIECELKSEDKLLSSLLAEQSDVIKRELLIKNMTQNMTDCDLEERIEIGDGYINVKMKR